MKNLFSQSAFLFMALLALVLSCKRTGPENINSLTPVNPYVYAYSSGVISKAGAVRVKLATEVAARQEIGKAAPEDVLVLRPRVEGSLIWEDASTLRFEPEETLPASTTFDVEVNVNKLIPKANGEHAAFKFKVRTRDQYFQTSLDGLFYPDENNYKKTELRGTVYTADVAEASEAEGMLRAMQEGRQLKVRWEHSSDQLTHTFSVEGVQRSDKPSSVVLQWDGKPLGTTGNQREVYQVPELDAFTLLDVRAVQGQEQHLMCIFSDPLQADQLLDGLLRLPDFGGNPRFIIEGNRASVYPGETLSGKFRFLADEGIRNSRGKRLDNEAVFDVVFEDLKPQVRLIGSGVVMPNSNGLIFPIEAVGLKAVDVEIFKIFHDNVLQFLQDNTLDGEYDLYKVGRIIHQEKVDLNALNPEAANTQWSRYALDLSKFIQKDDHAIYSVRIGFRPEYARLACQNKQDEQAFSEMSFPSGEDDDGEQQSIMDNWYGPNGYSDDYNWEKREDPCYGEYYNSERFVQRNVLASNLGLIAKSSGTGEVFVAVTDLRTTDPMGNTLVEIYDFQQQLIGKGNTGKDGMARIQVQGKPFVLVAMQNKERGYLRLQDGESLSMSRYDVSGEVVQKGIKGMIYAERGVWRPGDSIFLNFILEEKSGKLPEDYPVAMEVFNARGQLQVRKTSGRNEGGIYPFHFSTASNAPTGNWRVRIRAGGAVFEKLLKVETIQPNRLEVKLDFGRDKIYGAGNEISGQLEATWLHGAVGSGLKAIVESRLSKGGANFRKFPSFTFDDPARPLEAAESKVIFEGNLDQAGKARVSANLLGKASAPGMLTAVFRTRVFEPGGAFSSDYLTVPYSPYPAYAGIEIPRNAYGEPQTEVNKSAPVRFAVASPDGTPLEGRRLSVGIYAVEWRWWWDAYGEDLSSYNTATHYNAVDRTELFTNAQGVAELSFKPSQWGRYLIRVCDEESGHCAGDFVFAGYPWYGGEEGEAYREVASMLSFKMDKEKYKVGETATLKIPGGAKGRMLVSLENGSRVLQAFWVQSKAGENAVQFKVTPEMAPNVYANITLIQPHAQADNDLPIRLYGVVPVAVEDPGTRLHPVVSLPAALKPEQTVAVEVREKEGKGMAYTLAMVDEGLLGLTRFKTPDPHAAFYAREALGIHSWDVYRYVLGAFGGNLEQVMRVGGDAAIDAAALRNTANRFQPVVRFLGPFRLKAGSTNTHRIKLPNYAGAVRVMVVAASGGAYGATEKRVPVRNPIMALATAPRVLSPGDEFLLPVNIFANDPKVKSVQVTLEDASGLAVIEGGKGKTINFSKPGSQMEGFRVKIKNRTGVVRFLVVAQGSGERATQQIEVEVRNPNPFISKVSSEVLAPGKSWSMDLVPAGVPGTQTALLEVSTVPPLNLGERLEFLLQYPYGCIEQTVSAAFPQLFAGQLMDLPAGAQKKSAEHIKATIERLKLFQTADGGFAYWPGNSSADPWACTYAGHFLLEAKAKGYEVPANLLGDWTRFQKKAARLWDSGQSEGGVGTVSGHQLSQAYRLYSLALAGQPDMASMNRLRELNGLMAAARWRLAAAYALAGKMEIARQLSEGQPLSVEPYEEFAFTYGSELRDKAFILETLILLGDEKRSAELAAYISEQLGSNAWMSTQSTAQALVSMSRYIGDDRVAAGMAFTYQMGNSKSVTAGSDRPLMQIQLGGQTTVAAGKLQVKNTGKNKIFVRVIVRGQASPGESPEVSNDLKMVVAFKTPGGRTMAPENIPQGTDFFAEVRVSHPGSRPVPYQELALSQVFPAGWEIINARMGDLGNGTQSDSDYQDYRDDRVDTFFDLGEGQSKVYRVRLNAAYQGRFYLPPASCAAMYQNSVNAATKGQWVVVGAQRPI